MNVASENKLQYLRDLKAWSDDNGIQFSKRTSVLANRLYAKHEREVAKEKLEKQKADKKKGSQ